MNAPLSTASAALRTVSNAGEPAHFYHANGFPLAVYEPFLAALGGQVALSALEHRASRPGAGSPPANLTWNDYADDLIAALDAAGQDPVIGIGHSMGATCTVLAALKRPDLFSRLVLIEPATVSPPVRLLLRALPGRMTRAVGLIRDTLAKPDRWPDRAGFLADCRKHRMYRRFDEGALAVLAAHGVRECEEGGVTLAFPKAWEAHNYLNVPAIMRRLGRLSQPSVAIRGKPSTIFPDGLWREWQSRAPDAVFREDLRYGHLLPLEDAQSCCALIADGLSRLPPAD